MAPALPIDHAEQGIKAYTFSKVMGKAREISKGNLELGVLDYRHAEGTVESEGLGSSGQVDTELTISEDSSAPKRKCISLNPETCEKFGIPVEVVSISKMARYERRALKTRLRGELDHVRRLKTKFSSLSSNISDSSPYDDIYTFSDIKKRLPAEHPQRSSDVHASQVKKHALSSNHGPRLSQDESEQPPLTGQSRVRPSKAMLMECGKVLDKLVSHDYGWVFKKPVDVVELNIPDYFTIIKRPMDFGTIRNSIMSGCYSSPLNFAEDVRLTFKNAMIYNPPGNDVHIMAVKLSKLFERQWKYVEKKLSTMSAGRSVLPKPPGSRQMESVRPPVKKNSTSGDRKGVMPNQLIMTEEEKQTLGTDLECLLEELPEKIIDFLKRQSLATGQGSEDEIEVEIDILSNDTLFTLRQMLDEYMMEKQKKKEKVEHCEIELRNEPGLSNSSPPQCKDSGNDLIDEDVDVGGNDPPISGCPIEIEKDSVSRDSKRNNSNRHPGSSANGLGSSSGRGGAEKERQGGSVMFDKGEGVLEVTDRQDGESAPSERQVSPEKLYRQALLRGRFADTILKAREKTLDKDDKLDPERLRMRREELETQQRQERARLEAEAKAAEEARRKAEEDAAAEARRRRELDREAARQALQRMERTVDINEGSQFIEDLDMFRHSQGPSADDTTGGSGIVDLASFKFEGTANPLQQLGLFIRQDDDDDQNEDEHRNSDGRGEDGGEPTPPRQATHHPEEGEID